MECYDLLLIIPPFHVRNGGGIIFPLGLGYIISVANEKGYSVKIISCTDYVTSFYQGDLNKLEKCLLGEMENISPNLIGIGPCITSQIKALQIIMKCCKAVFSNTPLVAGGPLASIDGQEWVFFDYLGIDSIIKGDGEEAILDALSVLKNGNDITTSKKVSRRGISYFNEIQNIDTIPYPFRYGEIHNKISYRRNDKYSPQKTASMITSRGCIYNCYYCVSGNMHYEKPRRRSIQNIIGEMRELKQQYGKTDIIFYDDCFFDNPQTANKDVSAFCSSLLESEVRMTWQIELRPDLLLSLDDISIKLLEKSGCRQINIGIEKTTNEGLNRLGKTCSIVGLREKTGHIKEISKIRLTGTFILGGPEEDEIAIRQLISDSLTLFLDDAHFNPLFVYPGTPLYSFLFSDEKDWVDYIINDSLPWGEVIYENKYVNRFQLLDLIDYAYAEFYKGSLISDLAMVNDRFNLKSGDLS